jgi:hypothetical protein
MRFKKLSAIKFAKITVSDTNISKNNKLIHNCELFG